MPILVPADRDAPLSQGDLLSGVRLHLTDGDWRLPPDETAIQLEAETLALVISRPCAIAHSDQVVVAAVRKAQLTVPEDGRTFKSVKDWLARLRDGHVHKDGFYLGQLPGKHSGRYVVRLNSLHTILVPTKEMIGPLLEKHRIAALHGDFRRDLHIRILSSYAYLGFDDHQWYSPNDLEMLVSTGKADLFELEQKKSTKAAELAELNASGTGKDKQKAALQNEITNLAKQCNALKIELEPLEALYRLLAIRRTSRSNQFDGRCTR